MAIVYQHRRLDTDTIFYIGIGNKNKRAYNRSSRNNIWKKIVNKTNITVEILFEDITRKEACDIEMYLIKYYGRIDLKTGSLANLTDGGELNNGYIMTEETRKKQSELRKGIYPNHLRLANENKLPITDETRAKLIKLAEARKGVKRSLDICLKITEGKLKKIINTETGEIYTSIKDTPEANFYKIHTLRCMLNGQNNNKTKLKYI